MDDYILEMKSIEKDFSGVKVLDNVNIKIRRNEIHALCGENGAGKSTLMKIISGVYTRKEFAGELIYNGKKVNFNGIKDSECEGIVIIHQELNIVKSLNVYENIFLGNEIIENGLINKNAEISITNELLKRVGLMISPDEKISNLGTGQLQLLEIAKALNKKAKLLILDEPSASLSEVDTENLLRLLKELKLSGVTCIYISHKLEEVFSIADSLTVLRDGKTINTDSVKSYTMNRLIAEMVGRELTQQFPEAERTIQSVRFSVEDWTVPNPYNEEKNIVDHVSFYACAGEIVGFAGLVGAGRSELALSLFGAYGSKRKGKMCIDGKEVRVNSPSDAIKAGFSYLTEDRKRYGLVLGETIRDNMSLASLDRFQNGLILDKNKELVAEKEYVDSLRIKLTSLMQKARNLSGGNQQKVVIAKWLLTDPKVFIMDEPTRGVDVGAKYEIYSIMNELASKGVSIIMISSELPEILGMSDRIYVMHEGRIQGELNKNEATQEKILFLAAGGNGKEV